MCLSGIAFSKKSFFFSFRGGGRGEFGLMVTLHIGSGVFEFGGLFFFFLGGWILE